MNKKGLKILYKENPKPMGVFQVKNLTNGKIFIGSGIDVHGKLNSCKFQLAHGSFINQELQNDYNVVGESNFSFEIIDVLEQKTEISNDPKEELELLMSMWIEKLQPFDEKGYNRKKKVYD